MTQLHRLGRIVEEEVGLHRQEGIAEEGEVGSAVGTDFLLGTSDKCRLLVHYCR